MNGWWMVDEWLMNGWWMVDEWLMNGWWMVDEWLMKAIFLVEWDSVKHMLYHCNFSVSCVATESPNQHQDNQGCHRHPSVIQFLHIPDASLVQVLGNYERIWNVCFYLSQNESIIPIPKWIHHKQSFFLTLSLKMLFFAWVIFDSKNF
jgi:hypothetical protein